jgi:hypothetical protein
MPAATTIEAADLPEDVLALLLALFTLLATAASAFPPYRRALFRLVEPQREPGTRAGGSLHWGGLP